MITVVLAFGAALLAIILAILWRLTTIEGSTRVLHAGWRLIESAVKRLPEAARDEYGEEWLGNFEHLRDETPLSALLFAIDIAVTAGITARALRERPAAEVELTNVSRARRGAAWAALGMRTSAMRGLSFGRALLDFVTDAWGGRGGSSDGGGLVVAVMMRIVLYFAAGSVFPMIWPPAHPVLTLLRVLTVVSVGLLAMALATCHVNRER